MYDSDERAANADDIDRVAYTVKDTARLLSLSVRKVEYMVKTGELDSFTVGKARRVPGAVIRAFVARRVQQERGAA